MLTQVPKTNTLPSFLMDALVRKIINAQSNKGDGGGGGGGNIAKNEHRLAF